MKKTILFILLIIVFNGCKKDDPESPTPAVTACQLGKITYPTVDISLEYKYNAGRVTQIIFTESGNPEVFPVTYDNGGRLTMVDIATYNYDAAGRLVKETLKTTPGFFYGYESRTFEYNASGQLVKCSYFQYSSNGTVPKGQIFFYETYEYDNRNNIAKLSHYDSDGEQFSKSGEILYEYDDKMNPFQGHPGLFDIGLLLGSENANNAVVFSKNNITKITFSGKTNTTTYKYNSKNYPVSTENFFVGDDANSFVFEYTDCK
jgi:hypothetical protein